MALIAQTGMAQETGQPQDALLQSQIAVAWQDKAQDLAQLLAQRLGVAYVADGAPLESVVKVDQGAGGTVADLLASVNGQLPAGVVLRLAPGPQGRQLELARSATDRAVASVTAQALAPAVPAVSVAPVAPSSPPAQWQLSTADGTLRAALDKWAKQAGWQLSWEASVDVPIPVTASFAGDFPTAVKALFSALSASEVSLAALLYSGNQVLRVTESGHRSK